MSINTIKIDDIEYARVDSLTSQPHQADGLNYCIIRSRDQGVMCGYVKEIKGRAVTLLQARQIWRYDSTFVLPDVAENGMRDKNKALLSAAMSQPMIMLEACGVLTCTKHSAEQLISIEAQKK